MEPLNKASLESAAKTTAKNPVAIVVYDNESYKKGLEAAWGFSCVIKGIEKTILFDTGGNGLILMENMKKLEINPEDIDIVVLSHIHWDHVGGLYKFLEKNCKVAIYIPASFPASFKDKIKEYGASIVEVVNKPLHICEGVYSTGELGLLIKEQSLIIHTDKGLAVITGCAHPGIAKIVNKSKKLINSNVLLAIGGFHLKDKSKEEIEKIISRLKELGVYSAGPCHCSGNAARVLFEKEYGKNFIEVGAGKEINIEG